MYGAHEPCQQRAHVERLHIVDLLDHAPAANGERERRAGAHGAGREGTQPDGAIACAVRRIAALMATQVVRRRVRDHLQFFRVAKHRRRVDGLFVLDEAHVVDEAGVLGVRGAAQRERLGLVRGDALPEGSGGRCDRARADAHSDGALNLPYRLVVVPITKRT